MIKSDIPFSLRFWDGEKMYYKIQAIEFEPEMKVKVDNEWKHHGVLMRSIYPHDKKNSDSIPILFEGDIIEKPN